jgi:hypothetical protein
MDSATIARPIPVIGKIGPGRIKGRAGNKGQGILEIERAMAEASFGRWPQSGSLPAAPPFENYISSCKSCGAKYSGDTLKFRWGLSWY